MAQCKDCKFYQPVDETKGLCFGYEVPANRDADECPQKAFSPKEKDKEEKDQIAANVQASHRTLINKKPQVRFCQASGCPDKSGSSLTLRQARVGLCPELPMDFAFCLIKEKDRLKWLVFS